MIILGVQDITEVKNGALVVELQFAEKKITDEAKKLDKDNYNSKMFIAQCVIDNRKVTSCEVYYVTSQHGAKLVSQPSQSTIKNIKLYAQEQVNSYYKKQDKQSNRRKSSGR